MKRLSQTLKVALALFVAVFANGMLPTLTAFAAEVPGVTETSVETDTETDTTNATESVTQTPTDTTDETTTESQDSEDTPVILFSKVAAPEQKSVYTPPTCLKTDVYVVLKNSNMTTATVTLTNYAALQHKTCVVSLNSYETEGPTWNTSGNQVFIDHDQVTLTAQHPVGYLQVKAPKCYGQTDLYIGSTKYDGKDGDLPHFPNVVTPENLVAYWNGGKKCEVPPKKVTICHRTDSWSNPYNKISVNENAADGVAGNSGNDADHATEHQGPIFYDGIKGKWGDIIPATDTFAGLNWTTQGQYIYYHDCNVPANPTVHVYVKSCERMESATDQVVVKVTNTADKTKASVTYTVTLGSVSKDITLADGASGYVTFTGMAPGSYSLKVMGSDGTSYTHKCEIKVDACLVTVEPPVVVDCDHVTIPEDTYQVHYVESYNGTSRIVTATAQNGYWLDDGNGNPVDHIVFTLDFSDLDCGKGEVTPPTVPPTPLPTPTELPHTGSDGWSNLLIALATAGAVYGAVYFAQPKRA